METVVLKDYLANEKLEAVLGELDDAFDNESGVNVGEYVKKLLDVYKEDDNLREYVLDTYSKYYPFQGLKEFDEITSNLSPFDKCLAVINIYLIKWVLDDLSEINSFDDLSSLNQKRAVVLASHLLELEGEDKASFLETLDKFDQRLIGLALKRNEIEDEPKVSTRVFDLDKYGITKEDVEKMMEIAKTKGPEAANEYLESLPDNLKDGLKAYMADFVNSINEDKNSLKITKPFEKLEDGVKVLDNNIFEEPLNYVWDLSDLFGGFLKAIIDRIDFDVAKELRQDSKATHEKLLNLAIKDGIDMSKMSFANDYCNLWSSLKGYAKVVGRIFDYPEFYEDFAKGKNEQLTKEITLTKGNEYNTDDLYNMLDFFTYTYDIIGDDMARLGIIDDLGAYKSILNEPYDSRTVEEKVQDAFKCMNEESSKNPSLKGAVWTCVNVANAYQKVISLFGELYDDPKANYNIGSWNDWFKEKNIEGFSIK